MKTIEQFFPENTTHSLAEYIQQQSQQAGKLTTTAWGGKKRTLHVLGMLACACTCGIDGRGEGCRCENFIGVDMTGHSDLVSCSLVGQICEMPGK